ncbi:UNVERIFIED_CONTAM: hypothetical protein GTU68_051645 [Idotea baltica]|nr:hypothetical protein [Idotea baltica]
MFANIAPKYDQANDVLSFGIHRLWRTKALKLAQLPEDAFVVDICTGTGDVAYAAAKLLSNKARVIGIDFVYPMLSLANQKQKNSEAKPKVEFIHGNAMHLPIPDKVADASFVSFGIRNVDIPLEGLKEMQRIVKPGGRVVVIEFGQPRLPIFSDLFRWYSKHVMPIIGGVLTGNKEAYKYLPETAATFPAGDKFCALMKEAGLESPRAIPLLAGLAYIYIAKR